jgi:hypothetical protein
VVLPVALLWSWRVGKGTASESKHLQRLLPSLPLRSLIVADAGLLGYELFRAIGQAGQGFLVRLSSNAHLYTERKLPLERFRQGLVYYWPSKFQRQGQPPLQLRLLRVRGQGSDVWLLTNLLERRCLSHRLASQIYRWRWRNEGLFRIYKRMLGKVKLQSRTVATVHREAQGSLLALQLLLALAADASEGGQRGVRIYGGPRWMLLRLRGELMASVRRLGPHQFRRYQWMLAIVRSTQRIRTSSKIRQDWPRKKKYKPPGPPHLRMLTPILKQRMQTILRAA